MVVVIADKDDDYIEGSNQRQNGALPDGDDDEPHHKYDDAGITCADDLFNDLQRVVHNHKPCNRKSNKRPAPPLLINIFNAATNELLCLVCGFARGGGVCARMLLNSSRVS